MFAKEIKTLINNKTLFRGGGGCYLQLNVNICFSRGVGDLWNYPLRQQTDKCIFMLSVLMSLCIWGQSSGNFVTVCDGTVFAVFGLTRPGPDWIFYTSALINRHAAWCEHVNADWRVCSGTSISSTGVGTGRRIGRRSTHIGFRFVKLTISDRYTFLCCAR